MDVLTRYRISVDAFGASCVAESVNGRRRRFVSVPRVTHSASELTDRHSRPHHRHSALRVVALSQHRRRALRLRHRAPRPGILGPFGRNMFTSENGEGETCGCTAGGA